MQVEIVAFAGGEGSVRIKGLSYLERLGVGGHDNELGDASVERLGGFVGTFSELLVVSRLLHQIQDRLGQVRIGQRVRFWVYFIHILCL